MDILFKNSFILTEKLILECRVAFISKWDKFFLGFYKRWKLLIRLMK